MSSLLQCYDKLGGCHDLDSRLTTQAQRPGPRDAWIATVMRWPGSLQRMVRPFHVPQGISAIERRQPECAVRVEPAPTAVDRRG